LASQDDIGPMVHGDEVVAITADRLISQRGRDACVSLIDVALEPQAEALKNCYRNCYRT
jgi:hypothetical protein